MLVVLFLPWLFRESSPVVGLSGAILLLTPMDRKLVPKCIKVARPTLFGYIETRDEFEFYVNELFTLLKSGQLKVKIHKIYPLEESAAAHQV